VLLAECEDGLGRSDFLDWFSTATSGDLAEKLCEKYQVNGQTAWNLLRIAESHDVRIMTTLDESVTSKMRLKKTAFAEIDDLIQKKNARGYILAQGAKFHIKRGATSS